MRLIWEYHPSDVGEIVERGRTPTATTQAKLTADEVQARYGWHASLLSRWADEGCAALKWGKLRFDRGMHRSGRSRHERRLYYVEDLEAIKKARLAAVDKDPAWRLPDEARGEFPALNPKTLHTWSFNGWCPPIGRRLRTAKILRRLADGRLMERVHFHRDDIDALAVALGFKAPAGADTQKRVAPLPANEGVSATSLIPPKRRGRPIDPKVQRRNIRIRQLRQHHKTRNDWERLATLAEDDPEIQALGLSKRITRHDARNACDATYRKRGAQSRN